MTWTPERIAELWQLYRQGQTSYQIAAHFNVTRNTICGKLHRLKIEHGILAAPDRSHRIRKPAMRKPMLPTLSTATGFVFPAYVPPPPPPDEGQLASIVDVTGCRWPVKDDPDMIGRQAFCNHAQKDGSAYCPYHASVNVAPYSRKLISKTLASIGLRFKGAA